MVLGGFRSFLVLVLTTKTKESRMVYLAQFCKKKNKKKAEWYKSLNPEEKEKLLSGRAKWYKTLDPTDKDKIISQVQANKEAHRNSVQRDLVH